MAASARPFSRRSFLFAGLAGTRLAAQALKGTTFPSDWRRYSDPTTEMEVYRLTDPAYSSTMPAYYNRAIARSSGWMLFCCDRGGSPQAFHMDLKSGETRQLTEAAELDGASIALLPDDRSFCFFAGRSLHIANLATMRERKLYEVPEGWNRGVGMSVSPDGTHAAFAERRGAGWRLRTVPLSHGEARTVLEAPVEMGDPIARPRRAQILYRHADQALWLVDSDGKQNRRLKLAAGRVRAANWAPDGKTILYLNIPEDRTQLNAIREYAPDTGSDQLVAKTSQFATFGFNRDTSVFVGASRNAASPDVLILLRVTRRELTLCEHKASHPESVAPVFAPDSQRIYFQSDRDGHPAIYCVHAEKLVEKTDGRAIAFCGLSTLAKVGQTIVLCGLLGWAFGPRKFMKNGHHGNGGSDEVVLAVKKSRSLVCLTLSMRALRE
jgi:oligogalacturonide lyase